MVPWGNRSYAFTEKAYPWKQSEGKYAIETNLFNIADYSNMCLYLENKISIINNLYQFSYNTAKTNTNAIGMTTTSYFDNTSDYYTGNSRNGYGLSYQDNYEDKLEIRVQSTQRYDNGTIFTVDGGSYYSKNGLITAIYSYNKSSIIRSKIHYKSTNAPYTGLLPVFSA